MSDDWYYEEFGGHTRLGLRVRRVLYRGQSRHQRIEVLDTEVYGRVLVLDGVFQTSEAEEHFYHEMLVHPALASAPSIARVLLIGGGDGGSAREILRHAGVERLVMVEIDAEVVEVSRRLLPSIGTAWDDPRLEVVIGDGVAYARDVPHGALDAVILDGSDPIGPSKGLFDAAFYASCARALAPEGILALQSESPFLMGDVFADIQRTLPASFARVHPYLGYAPIYGTGMWSWTCATQGVDPREPDEKRAASIERETRYYNRAVHRAAFALPNGIARAIE